MKKQLSFGRLILTVVLCLKYFSPTEARSKHYHAFRQEGPGSPDVPLWVIKEVDLGTEHSAASAEFSDQIQTNGWSFLRVVTNERFSDEDQAYAAGLLEGDLTCRLMKNRWFNILSDMCDGYRGNSFCTKLRRYLQTNQKWIKKFVSMYGSTKPYWHQVGLILKQLEGLEEGCKLSLTKDDDHQALKDFTFLLLSFWPETWDLKQALRFRRYTEDDTPESCSALIKWTMGENDVSADLYVGHVSWNYYNDMLRILKNYEFHFHLTDSPGSPLIPGYNMTFSSYPGTLNSMDDFNLISSGLMTLETTNNNNNDDLWKFVKPRHSVPEFIRNTVANRLATNGREWTQLFAKENSGTYNNQWMIVDYNRFDPDSQELKDGLLWVIEEMPGHVKAEDRTDTLRAQGYWPSYNIPYFPSIFNVSGHPEMVDWYGNYFSYEDNARAQIFRRDQHKVVDLDSMVRILRYNDYLHDNLSICDCVPRHNAMLAISSRGDLNPVFGSYPSGFLGNMPLGATDLKVTNFSMFQDLQFLAISGPTYDSVPPFRWSTYEDRNDIRHTGMPDLWKFEPVLTTWK